MRVWVASRVARIQVEKGGGSVMVPVKISVAAAATKGHSGRGETAVAGEGGVQLRKARVRRQEVNAAREGERASAGKAIPCDSNGPLVGKTIAGANVCKLTTGKRWDPRANVVPGPCPTTVPGCIMEGNVITR